MTYEYTESIPIGSKIIHLTASSLKDTSCRKKFFNTNVLGVRPKYTADLLRLGSALHKYIEVHTQTNDLGGALTEARTVLGQGCGDSNIAMDSEVKTLIEAVSAMPRLPKPISLDNGALASEVVVYFPWRTYVVNDTTYCIVVCATLDLISLAGDIVRIIDFKSSSYYKTEHALAKYKNESQFLFYLWLCYHHGHRFLPLHIHNLIRDRKVVALPYVIQVGSNKRWVEGPCIGYSQELDTRYSRMLDKIIETVIIPAHAELDGCEDKNGWLANVCAQCDFSSICHQEDPNVRQNIEDNNFVITNPLDRYNNKRK